MPEVFIQKGSTRSKYYCLPDTVESVDNIKPIVSHSPPCHSEIRAPFTSPSARAGLVYFPPQTMSIFSQFIHTSNDCQFTSVKP
jgi:hypothetical protein